ncbi:formate hydrogenlyase maturation HycH family protein [Rahnella variigena]|jgi:formate hydrogenlyase maturation protein HycH|uniref:Formate hydrogenlyase maturation protein HycH n=1 Tax=Rahnella variigena TaxID=574964 RepID=A0ABX9Q0E6_9GAMM|nr:MULTISPECIES: formate hydrogenlyase maturation HycH family protein [Rahnella]RBQ34770.1 formate hydrogenlyase maturation protein HycH [Rahnella aquatilis]RJT55066.1 formate hydrogenlyase maturation protein HycH [Rahnella variigena]RKF70307.1 formate hydrogenlyase maturation protein HycH [Rahnella variigena]
MTSVNDQRYARHQPYAGHTPDKNKVVFYSLSSKFVDEKSAQKRSSQKAQEVIYYSLAIGHHLGVIDCLQSRLECPLDGYLGWINCLAENSEARRKLAGVQRFGEINIDSSHTHLLALALRDARPQMNAEQQVWSDQLIALLSQIEHDPAMYLMVRRYDA